MPMSESNTPYTPGGTPSINTDVDPSRLLPQLQQHFPRGINDPKVYSALAAVARQQQHETQAKATPTQLTPAQWGAVAAQHIQRQNKQRSQLQQTPTQQTPSNQTPSQQRYQQYPQYGYYQQHQNQSQTPTPTYGYQQTYSGRKSTPKEGSKSRWSQRCVVFLLVWIEHICQNMFSLCCRRNNLTFS